MSEYDIYEESVDNSAPYELYKWVGTYRNYYMTTANKKFVFEEQIYIPISGLSRNELNCNTHEDSDNNLEISLPITEQLARDYAFQISPPELTLYIYRFHRDSSSYIVYFKGAVNGINTEDEIATFKIPNAFGTILAGNIPNVYIQPPCNHALFDELCKVNKDSNKVLTSITSVSGLTINVNSIGGFPDNWMKGGEIAFSERNERRTIVSQVGTTLTINYAFGKAVVGEMVEVVAGCDHSFSSSNGCPKFNNQLNFGGFPYVPGESDNIFLIGV